VANEGPQEQFFKFTDARQRRIYERLQLVGEGTPAYFKDACRLLDQRPLFETTTHLVGHLIREIESSLRSVLFVFTDSTETIATSPESQNRETLLESVLQEFPELEIKSREGHRTRIREILKGLEIPEDHAIAMLWLKHAPSLAHGRAHRDNLNSPRPADADFRQYIDEMESVFDFLLSKFESKYTAIHAALDAKLQIEDPTNEDAKWLKKNIPNNRAALGYFFANLHNPKWLWPLRKEGLFSRPPEPQFDPETKLTSFPRWPASMCLVRFAAYEAADVKAKVAEILRGLESSNFVVHLDILEAACRLPGDMAAPIADKELAWLESNPFIDTLVPDKFADLVTHLAKSGDVDRALAVNRVALGIVTVDDDEQDETERLFVGPKFRLDRWHYGQFVAKTWASLANADWEAALTNYCELMHQHLEWRYPSGKESGDSHSSSWLSGVGNDTDEISHRLIATIRDISELAISNDISALSRVLEILESYKWDVFQRIVFHLLRSCRDYAINEIKARLLVPDTFRDRNLFHEYSLLLSEVFDELSENERRTILEWVDTFVPPIETVQERAKEWNGVEISKEEAEWHIRRGKLRWLEVLKDKLPEEWRLKYEEWTEHFGGAISDTFGMQVMWAGEPPIMENLAKLTYPERILEYLRGDLNDGDSPYELARELSDLVSKDPESYIAISEAFHDLAPHWVRAFFSGIHASAHPIPVESWPPLLTLMQWVLDRHGKDEAKECAEIREVIGDIISSSLLRGEVKIPFELRVQVWAVIEALTNDPNPTVAYEEKYGGENMDPLTLSLNTVRGEAFHTLFKYVDWCRQTLNIQDRTLESTTEVLPVLERHLRPDMEPSLAVRAVYGERLPALIAYDPAWVENHMSAIFPVGNEHAALYKAAWETFIIWTRPYDNVFEMLKAQYDRVVGHLGDKSFYRSESAAAHLSEHLIVFYARGIIELDEGGVLQRFYENASGKQAAHVFWFIARIVRENDVPAEVLQRFTELIEQRVKNGTADEQTAFGWLFSCGKFNIEWGLNLLREAVSSTKRSDPDHSVIERLSECAEQFPHLAIDVAIQLVDGADTEWKLQYWSAHLRTIIAAAVTSGDLEPADLLVNKLAAKNLPDFRNMLPGSSGRP